MTREQARQRQVELLEDLHLLVEKHMELLDAAGKVHRDIDTLTKELDALDTRLEFDGTPFQVMSPKVPTSFNEIMNIFDNLSIKK